MNRRRCRADRSTRSNSLSDESKRKNFMWKSSEGRGGGGYLVGVGQCSEFVTFRPELNILLAEFFLEEFGEDV